MGQSTGAIAINCFYTNRTPLAIKEIQAYSQDLKQETRFKETALLENRPCTYRLDGDRWLAMQKGTEILATPVNV